MDAFVQDDTDFFGNEFGIAHALIGNLDSGQSQFTGDVHNGNVPSQNGSSCPTCPTGTECPETAFWRQRYEQMMIESNQQLTTMNNRALEVQKLKERLAEAKKSMRMCREQLLEAYNNAEPAKKELADMKNQLLAELREKNRFMCEAESAKAVNEQLQAVITRYQEKSSAVSDQMLQLQKKEAGKTGEIKELEHKISMSEAKYRKVRTAINRERCQIFRLRRRLGNAGMFDRGLEHMIPKDNDHDASWETSSGDES